MRAKIHRTVKHDDGSKIQMFRYSGAGWGDNHTTYVSRNGQSLGCVVTYSDRTEVHPLLGAYSKASSVAEGARRLARTNGGLG